MQNKLLEGSLRRGVIQRNTTHIAEEFTSVMKETKRNEGFRGKKGKLIKKNLRD